MTKRQIIFFTAGVAIFVFALICRNLIQLPNQYRPGYTSTPTPIPTAITDATTPNFQNSKTRHIENIAPKTGYVANISGTVTEDDQLNNVILSFRGGYEILNSRFTFNTFTYTKIKTLWNKTGTAYLLYDGDILHIYNFVVNKDKYFGYFAKPTVSEINLRNDVDHLIFSDDNKTIYYTVADGRQIYRLDISKKEESVVVELPTTHSSIEGVWPIQNIPGFVYSYQTTSREFRIIANTPRESKSYMINAPGNDGLSKISFSPNLQYYCLEFYFSASSFAILFDRNTLVNTKDIAIANCGPWVNNTTIILHNYDGYDSMYSFKEKKFLTTNGN